MKSVHRTSPAPPAIPRQVAAPSIVGTRDDIIDELEDASAWRGAANPAEWRMLLVMVTVADADGLLSITIAELARCLGLSDRKNVRRVRDGLLAVGLVELLWVAPPGLTVYRLNYPRRTPERRRRDRAAACVLDAGPTTLPLPLFEAVAMDCARLGAAVTIDRDTRRAFIIRGGTAAGGSL